MNHLVNHCKKHPYRVAVTELGHCFRGTGGCVWIFKGREAGACKLG